MKEAPIMHCRGARSKAPGPLIHWLPSGESFFSEAAEGAEANARTLRQKD